MVPDTNCCGLQPYRVKFEKKLKRNFEEERRTIPTEKRGEERRIVQRCRSYSSSRFWSQLGFFIPPPGPWATSSSPTWPINNLALSDLNLHTAFLFSHLWYIGIRDRLQLLWPPLQMSFWCSITPLFFHHTQTQALKGESNMHLFFGCFPPKSPGTRGQSEKERGCCPFVLMIYSLWYCWGAHTEYGPTPPWRGTVKISRRPWCKSWRLWC